jgi:hypothetical protein
MLFVEESSTIIYWGSDNCIAVRHQADAVVIAVVIAGLIAAVVAVTAAGCKMRDMLTTGSTQSERAHTHYNTNIAPTLAHINFTLVLNNYTNLNNEQQLWESNTAQARECKRCSAKLNKKGELVLKKWLITMQKIPVDPALAPNVILASAEEQETA